MKKIKIYKLTFIMIIGLFSTLNFVHALTPINAQFIYINNSFVAGWSNATSSFLIQNNLHPYQGFNSLTMNFGKAWDEIPILNKTGIDVSDYEGLSIVVAGDKGGERVDMVFYGADGKWIGSANLADFMPNYKISKDFTQIFIPFRFMNLKSNVISKILFTDEKPGKIYVNNMLFSSIPSNFSFSGYYVHDGKIFDGDIEDAWHTGSWDADMKKVTDSSLSNLSVLQGSIKKSGGGAYLENLFGMNTYLYSNILITLKGSALSNRISMALYSPNKTLIGSVWLNDLLTNYNYDNYQTISIPLVYFGAQNILIKDIIFSSVSSTTTFYISDMHFE